MNQPTTGPVPLRYRGVWARTLLETPGERDTTTWVRWMQTPVWHADLRVPDGLDRSTPQGRAAQQGFCGVTEVVIATPAQRERCTWHRHFDLQPPRGVPDVGEMVFETPERVIETGVHGTYLEVWERVPGSTGQQIALGGLDAAGESTPERLLLAGNCLMHARPRSTAWPADTRPGDALADVMARHPHRLGDLLDLEVSFGVVRDGAWRIEKSSLPWLDNQVLEFRLEREGPTRATVCLGGRGPAPWRVLAWEDAPP